MSDQNKNIKDELSKMDKIFEKIANKYKNQKDEYLSAEVIEKYLLNSKTKNSGEIFENNVTFHVNYPFCYLRKDENQIYIKFLVKAKFIDEKKNTFSFWVCSLDYLKKALESLGYKEAKIIKKKENETNKTKSILIYKKDEQNDKDKDSGGSASESLEDKSGLDFDLSNYTIRVTKNPFSLDKIFEQSQKIFDPVTNNENIKDYLYDITLPEKIDEKNFICSKDYLIFMNNIFDNQNYKTSDNFYCYNEKSGLTLSLLQILEKKREINKIRYFHFNSEFIEKYKKKYIYFKLAKLFKTDEKNKYKELIIKISDKIKNYDILGILTEIIKELDEIYIIFDNIKNYKILYKIIDITSKFGKIKNNFFIFKFIQINSNILNSISFLSNFSTLLPNENSFKQELPLSAYVHSLKYENEENKKIFIENYKNDSKNIIINTYDENIFYLIFLIKLLFSNKLIKYDNILDYNYKNYLIPFLPYLYISIYNNSYNHISISKIEYRANFIEEIIYDIFNSVISKNLQTEKIFSELKNKSTEGVYLEKQIIYHLVIKNIEFEKINIDKIYCFDYTIEKNITKDEIIFIQSFERAPIYDFGIITIINGEPIFKGYQIGINKPFISLVKLSQKKIKMDTLYFISKINKFLKKKIKYFCFGIITTKNAYDSNINKKPIIDNNYTEENDYDINEDDNMEDNDNDYKNYNIMKKYCNNNNFEFILFDPKNKKFYIENEKSDLIDINFKHYLNSKFKNNVTNYIFNNEENLNLIKTPLYGKEIVKKDKNYIYKSVSEIRDKELIFLGKFCERKKEKTKIKEKNKIKFEVKKQLNFDGLINNNYLIYAKGENVKNTIYYNKKFYCGDSKNIDEFYVFDTSLNKSEKEQNMINNNNSENTKNNVNIISSFDNPNQCEKINDDNNIILLGRKENRNEIKESEELEQLSNDDDEDEDDEIQEN